MQSDAIPLHRLYGDLAWLWPLMSPPAEYVAEAAHWKAALRENLGPGRRCLLELGVGGGHNLSHLTGEFDAVAVDLSEPMLAHSRRLNPGVEHFLGDMRTVRLGRTFDAVVIHDAIAYMLSGDDLRAAFATAAAHLGTGGVFVTSPDYVAETFVDGSIACETRPFDGGSFTYVEYQWDPDPSDTQTETVFTYIIRRGGKVQIEQDRHLFGLFPLRTWESLMAQAGFAVARRDYPVRDDGQPRWLLIGRKL